MSLVRTGQRWRRRSCPACGATIDAQQIVTKSGWEELPGRKDMAKFQFGNSFCQIEGTYVPVADMNLAPEDSIYFAHHVLLWKDPQVNGHCDVFEGRVEAVALRYAPGDDAGAGTGTYRIFA